MRAPFLDRQDAGRQLSAHLRHLADRPGLVVLGLPRGGVPVAHEVAEAIHGRLDVFTVRKLGVPGHEELAMGAVATGGVRVINTAVVAGLRIPGSAIDRIAAAEQREIERRELVYRGDRPFPDLQHATVVLVDDGVATGSTMLAAVRSVRQRHPAHLVVAAPVMSREAHAALTAEADECITLAIPEPFTAVGVWYRNFAQTTDAEVLALLEEGAGPHLTGAAGSLVGPIARRAVVRAPSS